jgi:hypothetical protein
LASLASITVTVGNIQIGSSVSISNFPASQVITGSVAVTTMPALSISSVTVSNFPQTQVVSVSNLPATQSVTFGQASVTFGQIGGTVSVGSIPAVMLLGTNGDQIDQEGAYIPVGGINGGEVAISGTVTANVFGRNINVGSGGSGGQLPLIAYDELITYGGSEVVPVQISTLAGSVDQSNPLPISGTVTANVGNIPYVKITDDLSNLAAIDESNSGLYVSVAGSVTLPISGTVTASPAAAASANVTVFSETSSTEIAAANAARKVITIFNSSANPLYVLMGTGTASSTNFSFALGENEVLSLSNITCAVQGVIPAGGDAYVTELE